jgi:hypothetical protein
MTCERLCSCGVYRIWNMLDSVFACLSNTVFLCLSVGQMVTVSLSVSLCILYLPVYMHAYFNVCGVQCVVLCVCAVCCVVCVSPAS